MKVMTIHEKIGIRAVLAKRGVILPRIDARTALHFWYLCCPGPITRWATLGVVPVHNASYWRQRRSRR